MARAERRAVARCWLNGLLVLALAAAGPVLASGGLSAPPVPPASAGERLYLLGERANGTALIGQRQQGGQVSGQDAACASCHRHSGLGTFEGAVRVPPVAWRLLSRSAAEIAADRSLPHVLGFRPQRPAYTRATLARALREGVGADGKPLSWVMPRYPGLSEPELDSLIGHLRSLAAEPPAGAADGQLRFALVATPGADPARIAAASAVFERAFADHNTLIGPGATPATAYDIPRNLHLLVWQLSGSAAEWPAQLARHQQADHPFALLGGLGGGEWAVIDRWCESHHMPLILPSIEAPDPRDGFYALHFQRGVTLEAAVVANDLRVNHPQPVALTQYWRSGDSGAAAARALHEALGPGWPVRDVMLPATGALPVLPLQGTEIAVIWLHPADYPATEGLNGVTQIYLSGVMADEPVKLPKAWAERARLTYPWELPARRRLAMNFPIGWLRAKGQPLLDERLQTDAWLASQILEAALADMVDAYYPDYLVERIESLLGHRLANAHYPRLALAPGQRFASKGAYLLRAQPDGSLTAEGGWRIP